MLLPVGLVPFFPVCLCMPLPCFFPVSVYAIALLLSCICVCHCLASILCLCMPLPCFNPVSVYAIALLQSCVCVCHCLASFPSPQSHSYAFSHLPPVQSGAIPLLVQLLWGGTDEGKEAAARAFWNLSTYNKYNKVAIAKAGAIPALVHLLSFGRKAGMAE